MNYTLKRTHIQSLPENAFGVLRPLFSLLNFIYRASRHVTHCAITRTFRVYLVFSYIMLCCSCYLFQQTATQVGLAAPCYEATNNRYQLRKLQCSILSPNCTETSAIIPKQKISKLCSRRCSKQLYR